MLSALHRTFGEPAEVLTPSDSPTPEPKAGEARIRTILSPIHNHDLWTVRGQYGYKPELPAIGGSEAVGIVDALGPGVAGIAPGTRVAAAGVRGAWAEYFLVPAKALVPLPDAIADEAAAQLIAMPFSAITLLDFLGVDKGDWVIQNTANGAVGKTLAMLAAARGINVINLVRRDEGVDEIGSLGIANAVSTASAGWKERVAEITGGAPIRAAVDSIGGDASGDLMRLLGEGGLLVSFGSMSGEPMRIPSGATIFKQAVIKGFWSAKVGADMTPERRAALIGELTRLVADGALKLPVEAVFRLDRIKDAVRASQASGKVGKVLLRP